MRCLDCHHGLAECWMLLLTDFMIGNIEKKVREQLDKIKDKGDLARIASLFDNYDANPDGYEELRLCDASISGF